MIRRRITTVLTTTALAGAGILAALPAHAQPADGAQGFELWMNDGNGSGSGGGSGGSGGTPALGDPITIAPSNFRVAAVNGPAITLAWDPIQVPAGEGPLRSYAIAYGQSPSKMPYQRPVVRTATSTTIRFNEGPGAHGLRHYFILWADPASPNGPHAGPISAVTK